MHYVYILQSVVDRSFYTGSTDDLKVRIREHNAGHSRYSSAKRPFVLCWYCAFDQKEKALKFERYLKSGSGFAFSRKRFL